MAYSTRNEQRLAFEVHGHDWTPVDFDGVTLMRRREINDLMPTPSFGDAVARSAQSSRRQPEPSVQERRQARMKFRRKKPPTDSSSS
jgi:CRISPR-associated protein Cas2